MRKLNCINWFHFSYFQQEVYLLQWGNLFLETVDCKYSTFLQNKSVTHLLPGSWAQSLN